MLGNMIAVVFALASALVIAWGTVVRHRIVLDASSRSVMRTAISTPLWWVGTAAAVVAYALQLVALGFGTLLVVQPILMLKLMFTLPLAAWYSRRRMPAHETLWCIALTVSVGFLVAYGRPTAGTDFPAWSQWWPAFVLGGLTLAALAGIAYTRRTDRALALGTACGVIYGYVALVAKVSVGILHHDGLLAMLGSWQFWVLVILAGTGTVVQQYSFHAGALKHSLPAMTIMEPIVAFGLGYWVLGEQFQVSSLAGWTVMGISLAIMITATFVLSRLPVGEPRTTH
ncbi:DMT family transporter [Corynebacterium sp.]|uniref:DMT family transporter n=1 Tax=Corynebacterium sp. TaxID=1720 RepID=UPI0026DAA4E7|nr:DMT family transporter [Corynebacterium sp.]MDO5031836.1 DMT family transporter [Corynebacterium sp.]